jgi:hypothetical protein
MVTMIRSDLDFILAQIKIAEADARGEPLLGTLIPNSELPWGLRRVDGSNNNLLPGQGGYGSADQPFPNAAKTVAKRPPSAAATGVTPVRCPAPGADFLAESQLAASFELASPSVGWFVFGFCCGNGDGGCRPR